MKKLLLISIFLIESAFALVSITPVEIGENVGFHTKVALSLETKRGTTDKDNYKGSIKVSYDSNSTYVTFIETSAEYGETNEKEDTNKAYLHYRYIHQITPKTIRGEIFLQTQQDKFKEIQSRNLVGFGIRFMLPQLSTNSKGYLGIGGFYEYIDYLSDDLSQESFVLNNYLAYEIDLTDKTALKYRLDFQPVIDNFNNYILIHSLVLDTKIYDELSLNISIVHDVDSEPADGVQSNNFSQVTSLVYEF